MMISKKLKIITVAALCVVLFACSKVTQRNFDKIEQGMTMDQVTALLGKPSHSVSINFGGISGAATSWREGNAEIDIIFLNNKVQIKNFKQPVDSNSKS